MKKFLTILFVFYTTLMFSTHLAGGDIQYRYIGDSTGISHHYKIFLRIYRDSSGVMLGNTQNVKVSSGCYNDINVLCTLLPGTGLGNIAPTLFDCVTPNPLYTKTLEIWAYIGYVVLPGKCSDYIFSWNQCCRPPGITNIPNSGTQGFYFEAELNNFVGNNTSPFFISEPVRAFCVGNNFNWKQSVIEPDKDSLWFSLIPCREIAFGTPTDIPFMVGYTAKQPVTTSPLQSLSMDGKTGLINFTPDQIEIDVLAVLVDEYRYDSILNIYVHIGSSNRDMMITISPQCSQQAKAGVIIDTTAQGTYIDTITGLPTIDYDCLDSSVVMNFATKLDCSTISADGTDFRLTTPANQPIPIKEIISICDVNNESTQILLKLHKPLALNGKYFLYSKIGNDGNTLLNKCGFPMDEFDTIVLNVDDCVDLVMELENVTVEENEYNLIEWVVNINQFDSTLFEKYIILREELGLWSNIGNVYNYKINTFEDHSINVDIINHNYKVYMVYNSINMDITRNVHSINLKSNGMCDSLCLNWTPYDGWNNPQYDIFMLDDITSNWIKINDTIIIDTSYCDVFSSYDDISIFKISTTRPDSMFKSESNWIICVHEGEEVLIIPNIVTPNGDGVNDLFVISGLDEYRYKSIRIYNRWGTQVFFSENYQNDWYASDVADGVYFGILDIGNDGDKLIRYNFSITVIKGK